MRILPVAIVALLGVGLAVPAASAADSDIPRTASGKPDLSGNYDISSLTPFQRPKKFGEQLYLTLEEAKAIEKTAADNRESRAQASDPDREAPPSGGNVGAYNDFWFEWGKDAFAIDGKFRTSILTDPSNGRMPPATEEGKKRLADLPRFAWQNKGEAWWLETGDQPYDGPETMVLGVRCIYQPTASVPIRPLPYNNLKTIVQTDTHVLINIEWMHWARIVRIDSEHLPSAIRSLAGDSIGWWEDDTLVVETTNFLASPGVAREGLRVVERFSPIDEKGLLYQFEVEDPDYEASYSGELLWPKTDQRSYEYACHEGNYAMGNTLRGARLLEQEWSAKQAGSGDE
jgi:hypothetical protein